MKKKRQNEKGFSLIELVAVVAILFILSGIAVMSFGSKKLYEADSQALHIVDIFQEARQRSLSQRTTMRVEINQTDQVINIIDEGRDPNSAADDVIVKTTPLVGDGGVFIGTVPANQNSSPVEQSPTPPIAYANSVHPLSAGDNVATLRFQRNGTVVNSGNDAIGTGSVPTGATVFVWSKNPNDTSANPTNGQVFRAVTVLASSGLTRMWKCPNEYGNCDNWVSQ